MMHRALGFGLLPLLAVSAASLTAECGEPDPPAGPPEYDLSAEVSVLFDAYGVPHVYGQNRPDVLFTQGYLSARDRLWQMDYLRRQAAGTRAEIFGEDYLDDDIGVRMLDFRRWAQGAERRIRTEDPQLYRELEAYAAGVNAWLEEAIATEQLPPQIVAIDYVPEPWTVLDSLLIDKGLGYGNSSAHETELVVWLSSLLLGLDKTEDLLRPQGFDNASVVDHFYDDLAATPPEGFVGAQRNGRAWTKPSPELKAQIQDAIRRIKALNDMPNLAGSNNWVVSGAHTDSGFPMLANDTHQGTAHPATYYQSHLNTADAGGDMDFVGYGYAGIPLFLFGHNQDAAYGLTNNMVDISDLYLETVVGNQVLFEGRWVNLDIREETFKIRPEGGSVADAEVRTVEMKWVPHHGPIYPPELIGDIPVDISAAWVGYSDDTITQVMAGVTDATSYDDMTAALGRLRGASVNVVYADIEGNIGYSAITDIPIREQLDYDNPPYMVLPGRGGYEWTGQLLPGALVPYAYNPESGYVATANNEVASLLEDNDPFNGPYLEEIGSNIFLSAIYDLGPRAYRIEELIEGAIEGEEPISMDDMMAWQGDVQSRMGVRFVPYILDAAARRPDLATGDVGEAVEILRTFAEGGSLCTRESVGCVVFHAWLNYFTPDFLEDETDPTLFERLDGTYLQILTRPMIHFLDATAPVIDALDFQAAGGCATDPSNPACAVAFPSAAGLNYFDDQDTPDRVETRDEVILGSLAKAVARVKSLGGGSLTGKTWGQYHSITFNDPAERVGYRAATLGPYSIDGALFTVDVAGHRLNSGEDFRSVQDSGGPSQRTVYELRPGAIRVRDALPGGQQEAPGSAHFGDQVDLYVNNQTRTLPFYRAEVEAEVESTLTLPQGFPGIGAPSASE